MKKTILALSMLCIFSCHKKQDGIKAKLGKITESVYASGVVKAKQQYIIYPLVSGLLKKKYVLPGQQVKLNQELFLLEDKTSSLTTQNAKLAYELAKENAASNSTVLNDLKLNLEQAAVKLSFDSALYFRQLALWQQNIGTKNELDQKQVSYQTSQKLYEAAKNKLKQTNIQLQNDLQRSKNNLLIGQKQTKDYTIKSEIDGKVFDVLKEEGELVNTQTPIAIIGRSDQFVLEFQIDEFDIIKIKLNQLVKVTMDSYKGQIFDAYITEIYPIMNEGTRTFKVDATFKSPPAILFPNLTAEANIIIQTKNNALTIPAAYLVDDSYVWIGKDKKRKVTTGLKDYEHVEIKSGLDSSEYIYLPVQ